jgi:ATP-binding cassette, subfamily B, bacterial MsbA
MSRVLKNFLRNIPLSFSASGKAALHDIFYLLLEKPGMVLILMGCNLLGAILEGGSMGLLGVAVSVLLGEGEIPSGGILANLKSLIDPVIAAYSQGGAFLILVGAAVVSQIARAAFFYVATTSEIVLATHVRRETQRKVTNHLMRMSYAMVTSQAAGSPANAIDQAQTAATLVRQVGGAARASCMLVAYLVLIFTMSPLMAFLTTLVAIAIWLLMGLVSHRLRVLSDLSLKGRQRTFFWTWEFINAPRLLRVFNSTEYAAKLINAARDEQILPERRSALIQAAINPAMEVLTIFSAGMVLILGYLFAGDSANSAIPAIFVYVLVFYRLKPNLHFFNNLRVQLGWLLPQLEMVQGFLNQKESRAAGKEKKRAASFSDEIRFDEVSFTYPGTDTTVLQQISFSIKKGQTVALVGPSGSGKSTTVDLLLGLYSPTSGCLTIDGVDIRSLDGQSWREEIGLVEQDIFLLNTTISENIAFAREDAKEEEIMAAAHAAHAGKFIMSLPDRLETVIGDRGHKLSGGQRQRLALARALLRFPDVLLLDEATSSLDSVSEKKIQSAIDDMHYERTILIIAHRLSTVENADNIIVMEEGRIVEQGSMEQLLGNRGHFWRLWESQSLEL